MSLFFKDEMRRLKLHSAGRTDAEIGEAVGVTRYAIAQWRYARKLSANLSVRPENSNSALSPEQEALRLRLHAEGLTDARIADEVGVSHVAVRSWRLLRGLPRNPQVYASEERRRFELYRAGATDEQIGQAVGRSGQCIWRWRQQAGLPSRPRRAVRATTLAALHGEGATDAEMAKAVGVSVDTVKRWRGVAGLSRNGGHGGRDADDTSSDRLRLYRAGRNDTEIAAATDSTLGAVRSWRHSISLPAHPPRRWRKRPSLGAVDRHAITHLRRMLGNGVAADLADDAVGDCLADLAAGTIRLTDVPRLARRYRGRVISAFASSFGPASIDEPIAGTEDLRLLDLIRDERSSSWLEEMGATAW